MNKLEVNRTLPFSRNISLKNVANLLQREYIGYWMQKKTINILSYISMLSVRLS